MENIEDLIKLIKKYKFSLEDEVLLKQQMEKVFVEHNMHFISEYILDKKNRLDFWIYLGPLVKGKPLSEKAYAIEVKIKGNAKQIFKLCERYCQFPIAGLVLITNKAMGFPKEINGKPCYVINLGMGWL